MTLHYRKNKILKKLRKFLEKHSGARHVAVIDNFIAVFIHTLGIDSLCSQGVLRVLCKKIRTMYGCDQKSQRLYQIVKASDMRPFMRYHIFRLIYTKPCRNIYFGTNESQHERCFLSVFSLSVG